MVPCSMSSRQSNTGQCRRIARMSRGHEGRFFCLRCGQSYVGSDQAGFDLPVPREMTWRTDSASGQNNHYDAKQDAADEDMMGFFMERFSTSFTS